MNSFNTSSALLAATPANEQISDQAAERGAAVFVVDSNPAFRTAIFRDFSEHDLRTTCFDHPDAFLRALRHTRPGCIILDMNVPDYDVLALQELLASQFCCIPLIMTARKVKPEEIVQAMRLGAHDVLAKPIDLDKLRAKTVDALLSARISDEREQLRETMRRRLRTLTPRESHILRLALTGRSNKEISNMEHISPRTVETHRARVMVKLGVTNLLELAHAFIDIQDWRRSDEPKKLAA